MDLEVSLALRGDDAVVSAQGEIDLTSCADLRASLNAPDVAAANAVVVDLTKVGFIDSTGLSVLVDGARQARTHGQAFGVVADGHLRELLRITGLDTVMDVHRDLDEAFTAQ